VANVAIKSLLQCPIIAGVSMNPAGTHPYLAPRRARKGIKCPLCNQGVFGVLYLSISSMISYCIERNGPVL
jgi:hypothetical protein